MTNQFNFLIATAITLFLVFITVTIHYEVLRLISEIIPKLKMQPRVRILVVIYGAFFAHTIEVWVFACAYYLLSTHLAMGAFHGLKTTDFFDFFIKSLYTFSFSSYVPIAYNITILKNSFLFVAFFVIVFPFTSIENV